jgi:DNA-binding response OmpR family regulator
VHNAGGRVLVVDDDVTLRNLLVHVLQVEGYDPVGAGSAQEALRQAHQRVPDAAIVDVKLGSGPDGFTVGRRLREMGDVRLIFLTGADSAEDIRAGFAAGADLYIEKPFAIEKLLARLESVIGRTYGLRRGPWRVGDLVVDYGSRTATREGRPVDLTPREFDILAALARRAGRVLSKEEILIEVWGYRDYTPNTVERHLSALRRKLHQLGPALIHTVRGSGYILRG